jgi:hypothetical protein
MYLADAQSFKVFSCYNALRVTGKRTGKYFSVAFHDLLNLLHAESNKTYSSESVAVRVVTNSAVSKNQDFYPTQFITVCHNMTLG